MYVKISEPVVALVKPSIFHNSDKSKQRTMWEDKEFKVTEIRRLYKESTVRME
jgi:hypothetical protein